jgi:hypothetical protein
MAHVKDFIPQNPFQFNEFFGNIVNYVDNRCGGAAPVWTHIPQADRNSLKDAYARWYAAYSATLRPHTSSETADRNIAFREASKFLRLFINRFFRYGQVSDGDLIGMEIPVHDPVRTPLGAPDQLVQVSLEPSYFRVIRVNFRAEGAANRARPYGCNGAVIKLLVSDAPADSLKKMAEAGIATRTPHILTFPDEERGKVLSVAMCWQNKRGECGLWSDIAWAFIP